MVAFINENYFQFSYAEMVVLRVIGAQKSYASMPMIYGYGDESKVLAIRQG
jgi:hypothetical protein